MANDNITQKNTIEIGKVYSSINYGKFQIIEKIKTESTKKYNYRIKFLATGFEKIVPIQCISSLEIKDPYYPKIFGQCCLGQAITTYDGKHNTKEYILWHGLAARCCNPNCKEYKYYGAKGVTMCDRWKCFEYFLEDLPKIPGYDLWKNGANRQYELEKDFKQIGSEEAKIYSLDTCYFTTHSNNNMIRSLSNADKYSSNYIGVYKDTKSNKNIVQYQSYICMNGNRINLGYYTSEEAAAQARDAAAVQLFGSDVILNNAPPLSYAEMDAACRSKKDCSMFYLRKMYNLIK